MEYHFNRILLVDDDDVCNFLHQRIFHHLKIAEKILLATHGREAFEILKKEFSKSEKPDLIVLDLNMPIMNGFEFLEAYQKIQQDFNIKIVVLTSSKAQQDMEKLSLYPVSKVLNKPMLVETFAEIVMEL